MQYCPCCKQNKDDTDFHKSGNRKSGYHPYCKECRCKKAKDRYLRDKEKIKSRNNKWWANESNMRKMVLAKYGMTPEDYLILFNLQEGRCAVCDQHQLELDHRLNVDHDHQTGEIRGLLCRNCNMALGLLRDNSLLIGRLKEYVEK